LGAILRLAQRQRRAFQAELPARKRHRALGMLRLRLHGSIRRETRSPRHLVFGSAAKSVAGGGDPGRLGATIGLTSVGRTRLNHGPGTRFNPSVLHGESVRRRTRSRCHLKLLPNGPAVRNASSYPCQPLNSQLSTPNLTQLRRPIAKNNASTYHDTSICCLNHRRLPLYSPTT
jgi:hypothetical protein